MSKGMIFDIQRNSFVDGPGIRTTVFFKGCNLHCAWCHNPESQAMGPQLMVYEDRCKGCGSCKAVCPYGLESCDLCGKCVAACPHGARQICGREYTVEEVLTEVKKDILFYKTSGGGVTFSGGECMLQIDFLEALLKKCKEKGIHTAVDTAGNVPFSQFERILPDTDLFLYDIKLMGSRKHARYTGQGNGQILENLKKLLMSSAKVWVRIPVITGVNDSAEEMQAIKAFMESCGKPEKIELLPYHAMAEHKYRAIGKEPLPFGAPDDACMQKLSEIF